MIFKCWSQSIITWWSKDGSVVVSVKVIFQISKDYVLVNCLSALTVVINLLKLCQVVWFQLAGLQGKGGLVFSNGMSGVEEN